MNHLYYKWAVIGAGPAGIAAVGKLIDNGINPTEIAWIDDEFKVGDFGTKWRKVSSNTKVDLFLKFFKESQAFEYHSAPDFAIDAEDPANTCFLELAADPLQWITDNLKARVNIFYGNAQQLKLHNRHWEISLADMSIQAKNVVLAIGAEPKSLAFPDIEEVALPIALDPDKLAATCGAEDVVAVFGASHSAIIILKSLLEECNIKKVINFYLAPLRYAVHFSDWILFDDTGLKGNAAKWAREHIDGKLPAKLERIISNSENVRTQLPLCNKVICATGFQRRHIQVHGIPTLEYNDKSGIIAPGLFGFGIAFPEAKMDRYGTLEYRVGLWKFMEYLNRAMPVWLNYGT